MPVAWTVRGLDPATVRARLEAAAVRVGIPEFARIEWQGDSIRVRIDRGGRSEFRLSLSLEGDGVRIAEAGRDVAFLHRAFVGAVEGFIDRIMADAGLRRA